MKALSVLFNPEITEKDFLLHFPTHWAIVGNPGRVLTKKKKKEKPVGSHTTYALIKGKRLKDGRNTAVVVVIES